MQVYSVEEVAKHNLPGDCWIVIRGLVYNVSDFVKHHKGGSKIILDNAGKDVTEIWNSLHDESLIESLAKQFLIGRLATNAPTATSEPSASSVDVKKSSKSISTSENRTSSCFGSLIPYSDPAWYQAGVSPYYGESHINLRGFIRKFVQEHVLPFVADWDESGAIPASTRLLAGSSGILFVFASHIAPRSIANDPRFSCFSNISLPAGIPIADWDGFHSLITIDEISRCGSGGAVWGITGGIGIGLPPILAVGTKHLIETYALPCILGKKIICLCVTEPSAGSDVAAITTNAVRHSDHYVLNGEKKWITNGSYADFFTVACRIAESPDGPGGFSLLVVERAFPGVRASHIKCSGVWASGTGYITFENVKVPLQNLIGHEGEGFKYVMNNFNGERIGMAAQAIRYSRVCFETAIIHSFRRQTFGVPLIGHQVVRHKLATMAGRIESVFSWLESLVYQTIILNHDEKMKFLSGPIALLKVQSSQLFEFCAREAAQILGGRAYTRTGQGATVERLYREVRAYAIPGGSEEVMNELGIRQSLRAAKSLGAKL